MAEVTTTLAGYGAALRRAAYYLIPAAGYVRVAGGHRTDFLQRQTTNDLKLVGGERAMLNVLTSPTARIMDVFTLMDNGEAYGLLTLPDRGPTTAQFLKSMIFFMDRVTVTDQSQQFVQFELIGPAVEDALARLGATALPTGSEIISAHVASHEVRILSPEATIGLGYRLVAALDAINSITKAFSSTGIEPLSGETYEILRIESGIPGPKSELIEAHTPLETGLRRAISSSKGCYTGQEVIARQLTFDKVTQQLTGVRLPEPIPEGTGLRASGKSAGVITSVAHSPRYGWIGLAMVKRSALERDVEVVAEVEGRSVTVLLATPQFE